MLAPAWCPGVVSGDGRGARIQLTQSDKRRERFPSKIFSSPASAPRHTWRVRSTRVVEDGDSIVLAHSRGLRSFTPSPQRHAPGRISAHALGTSSDLAQQEETVSTKLLEAQALGSMATTAPKTADYTPSRRSLELCPRSYDLVERAELDTLCVQLEGMPTVRSPSDRRRASNLPTFFP